MPAIRHQEDSEDGNTSNYDHCNGREDVLERRSLLHTIENDNEDPTSHRRQSSHQLDTNGIASIHRTRKSFFPHYSIIVLLLSLAVLIAITFITPNQDTNREEDDMNIEATSVESLVSTIRFREEAVQPTQVRQKIAHYRAGSGIILNVHVVHHGGTSFCANIGRATGIPGNRTTPSMACMNIRGDEQTPVPFNQTSYPDGNPWKYNDTGKNIEIVSQYFHMISWEYRYPPLKFPLREMNWEHTKLISVVVMRDPIDRLLAGDGWVKATFPNVHAQNGTAEEWWKYANTTHGNTDNYALRVFAGMRNDCCHGARTDPRNLVAAKNLIQRFTFVLDIACLDQGIRALADLLDITVPTRLYGWKKHPTARERIGHDEVYDFLLRRNKLDIELYEWSKSLALVNCSEVGGIVG